MVPLGFVDHQETMYKLSHFLPYSRGNSLLTHANETRKLWHERYVHINYRYLQELNKEGMVEGLLSIKFSNGTCKGCVEGKHAERSYEKGKARRVVQVLYLVHSYLIGPIPTNSYGGS